MDNDTEITLLSHEQIMASKVLKEHYRACVTSDFALLLGGDVNGNCAQDSQSLRERTIGWYLSTFYSMKYIMCINELGGIISVNSSERNLGIRPIMSYENIPTLANVIEKIEDEIILKTYGYYPQYAVSEELEKVLNSKLPYDIKRTGKVYVIDEKMTNKPFLSRAYPEFEYDGRKYIKFQYVDQNPCQLSNGRILHTNDETWIEVTPINWIVDRKSKLLISERALFAGKIYDLEKANGNFNNTDMYHFLNTDFKNNILSINTNNLSSTKSLSKVDNPFNLKFDKVTEEEIIKGAIESNVPVFLHGPSSEGKSARVKQIDPDCEIIYLRNATPESLNGKSVYNQSTGEMKDIPPTWLKKVKDKCSKEPDKLHIIFFDELTNALPSIQGMAFNIILDREVNGIWKLPKNARIVASGNEMSDSLAANQLAEPLFNRFAHVYIETTTSSWLKWASDNNIHPAIYTYIAYKKEAALRSKYDGKSPNADPRKWEMASKMLYQTENPYMLRSLVGEDITQEFVEFCSNKAITLWDVINDNYTEDDISSLNTASKYATIMGLTSVSEEHLEVVRNFAQKLGGEYRAIFDTLWTHNDEERLEKIALLNQNTYIEEPSLGDINTDGIELTLLSKNEVSGSNKLEILKNYGTDAIMTDLAIITGGMINKSNEIPFVICWYYTKSKDKDGNIYCIDGLGKLCTLATDNSEGIIRPIIKSPEIIKTLSPRHELICTNNGGYAECYEVQYGEYPQYVADYRRQKILEELYEENLLQKTSKTYTLNTLISLIHKLEKYQEYIYEGKKYIRVKVSSKYEYVELSNYERYKKGDYVWVEVEPINWLVDIKTQTLISEYGLVSGIRFKNKPESYDGNFKNTVMYDYLNNYFLKEIIDTNSKALTKTLTK